MESQDLLDKMEYDLCNVCDHFPASAGGLTCGHGFCPECFGRYVKGSCDELDISLRCSICGNISNLIEEISGDWPNVTFGRKGNDVKLSAPTGITRFQNGGYACVDRKSKRVNIFNEYGSLLHDFAYIHNTSPTRGVAETIDGEIAILFNNDSYDFVSFFTKAGHFRGSTYIKTPPRGNRPDLRGIACDLIDGHIYITDRSNSCIHVINNASKLQSARFLLKPIQFEIPSKPEGITVTPSGDILITDTSNHCLKLYDNSGKFLKKIGSQGERPLQFQNPTGVAITSKGEIFIADHGNQRVQLLDADGVFLRYAVRFKHGYDVYMAPDDVTVSSADEVTVLMTSLKAAEVGEIRVYP